MHCILQVKASVADAPHAKPLELKGGNISFQNVHFGFVLPLTFLVLFSQSFCMMVYVYWVKQQSYHVPGRLSLLSSLLRLPSYESLWTQWKIMYFFLNMYGVCICVADIWRTGPFWMGLHLMFQQERVWLLWALVGVVIFPWHLLLLSCWSLSISWFLLKVMLFVF